MGVLCKPVVSASSASIRVLLEVCGAAAIVGQVTGRRGLSRFCKFAGRFASGSAYVRVHPQVLMNVDAEDPYWISVSARWRSYEPELERLWAAFDDLPVSFIDAGANMGYWSIFASHREGWRVYAIEAAAETRRKLEGNLAANGARAKVIPKAVSEHSGAYVQFATLEGRHAGAHVVAAQEQTDASIEVVETIAIDDLIAEQKIPGPIILKLDVEGQELPAILGSRQMLSTDDALVVYEEHGSRPECLPTQYFLEQGFHVFLLTAAGPVAIRTLEEVVSRLKQRGVGYNLAATRSPTMLRRIEMSASVSQ